LKKNTDEAQLAIYKFKRKFRKMKKFGLHSPWEMDPWL